MDSITHMTHTHSQSVDTVTLINPSLMIDDNGDNGIMVQWAMIFAISLPQLCTLAHNFHIHCSCISVSLLYILCIRLVYDM